MSRKGKRRHERRRARQRREQQQERPPQESDFAVEASGAPRRRTRHGAEAGVQALEVKPVPAARPVLTRRTFVLGGFWSFLFLAMVGILGPSLDFAWPRRRPGGFGGPFSVSADRVPAPSAEPVRFAAGRFYLSHLGPGQEGSPGGLLAIYQKCTHLGCTVPWRADFRFQGSDGWFRCPCHGSTYTKGAAMLVFGPAPRPLDLFDVEVKENGDLVVNTGAITKGSVDNPQRVVPYGPSAGAEAGPSSAGPRFVIGADSFDLGLIRMGEPVERTVQFTNEGQEPLRVSILKVRPAPDAECGCGVEGFEVRPEEVPPGETGELAFTLRAPEGMSDMQDTMLAQLETNDPEKPTVQISLTFRMGP